MRDGTLQGHLSVIHFSQSITRPRSGRKTIHELHEAGRKRGRVALPVRGSAKPSKHPS
jgi:hypothetical protein